MSLRTIFETSDTPPLDALCEAKAEEHYVRQKYSNYSGKRIQFDSRHSYLIANSTAKKSFSSERKFNFSGHKFMSLENKDFWTNEKIKS